MTEGEFTNAYDKFSDAIFRHCYFKVSDREQALDLMQETFVKTWNYASAGGKIENVKAFLYKTASNLIIDYYRKKKTESLDNLLEKGFDPGESSHEKFGDNFDAEQIVKLFEKLGDKYSEVLSLKFTEDLSPKEIAEIIGESENVVSVRIHRGLARLREIIN